jgi:hypothetical protein
VQPARKRSEPIRPRAVTPVEAVAVKRPRSFMHAGDASIIRRTEYGAHIT